MEAIRVLVVDDQRLFREALVSLLDMEKGIEVIGEACDGEEAIEAALSLYPDVVLMDVRMPVMDGITAMREIKAQAPEIAVILLTMFNESQYVYEAISAGASGYIVKDASARELVDAITAVAAGASLIDPDVAAKLISGCCGISQDGLRECLGAGESRGKSRRSAG